MSKATYTYRGRLADFAQRADAPDAWEQKWHQSDLAHAYALADQGVLGVYRDGFLRHLPARGLTVEAGCGTGRYVRALRGLGYNVCGIEWDREIVGRIKQTWPDAPICCGDIRAFPLGAASVDAVISLGVIEHFEDPWLMLADTVRILKPGGTLYLAVPYANAWRRFQAARGAYPPTDDGEAFYQYLLARDEICTQLQRMGMRVRAAFATNALSGLESDVPAVARLVQRWRYGRGLINVINRTRWLGPLTGHVIHVVAQKA